MKNWIVCIWFSLGIVTLIFALFDFTNGISIRENTDSTTVLSILVTFLVAWQIWQTIDAKHTIVKMESSVKDAEKRDNQLQHLLEAFQIDDEAQRQTTLGSRYAQSVNALRSFILAGVPTSYRPINDIIVRLDGILNEIENTTDKLVKERFSRVNRECNNYYRDISKAIREQIELYADINDRLLRINDRRRKLATHSF